MVLVLVFLAEHGRAGREEDGVAGSLEQNPGKVARKYKSCSTERNVSSWKISCLLLLLQDMVGGVEGTDDDVLLPVGFPAVVNAVLQRKEATTNPD